MTGEKKRVNLFNLTLNYNAPQNGANPLFNGNISQTSWNTASVNNTSNPVSNSYTYTYDALNRIIGAKSDANGNYNLGGFNTAGNLVNPITYDKNGNILHLKRNGHINAAITNFGIMDNLTYTYDNGNKLVKVVDTGNTSFGFKDVNNAVDFVYDDNGNLLSDANKQITSIKYNHLNMPMEIKFNNSNSRKINYTYTADGIKLRKVTNDNGSVTTTDYTSNFIYKNNTLEQFYHPEGYIKPNGNNYNYVYQHKDIWGNTRITYSDTNGDGVITPNTEILREQNHYPFGLEHKGYNSNIIGVKSNYKQYQKQEFTEDLGLNTHEWKYRVSDPAIGRFWQIDPLAEDYVYNSTYAFQENKMGMGVELEGRELRKWFANLFDSGGDYQPVSQITTQNTSNSSTLGNSICTIGCHDVKLDGSADFASIIRDVSADLNLGGTSSDAVTTLLGKTSMLGKFSSGFAITTAAISIWADAESNSTSAEFTANTIQGVIETGVGLKDPVTAIGLHINFQDAKSEDGLTNLSNGRMSNAYSSSQRQTQNYLKKNFYNRKYQADNRPYEVRRQSAEDRARGDSFLQFWLWVTDVPEDKE